MSKAAYSAHTQAYWQNLSTFIPRVIIAYNLVINACNFPILIFLPCTPFQYFLIFYSINLTFVRRNR